MFVLWTPYRSIHCGSKSDRDRNYLSTIKGDRFSVYNLNKSDVFDRLRLHPHNTIIPPQNKNILVWNKNVLT
ncbi:MAG: hypothetical protein RMZ42_32695 [Nostoc sp. DedQUE05]|uniref:hypothetical protein n=1 Tax=Nostoc sp. DedQUE05 TaxID=3075391 RepID=UPI002AD2F910|nr:hypothetical protein [Nostoc sp. DedQUE05]MDZ8096660.1 hypothetical protein [Nostoc sp. DedQUE05]